MKRARNGLLAALLTVSAGLTLPGCWDPQVGDREGLPKVPEAARGEKVRELTALVNGSAAAPVAQKAAEAQATGTAATAGAAAGGTPAPAVGAPAAVAPAGAPDPVQPDSRPLPAPAAEPGTSPSAAPAPSAAPSAP